MSGDMFLGAMLDLGLDLAKLEAELKKLPLEGYHLHARHLVRGGIQAVKFDVHVGSQHHGQAPDEGHEHDHEHDHDQAHGHEHGHHEEEGVHTHNHAHDHEHDHARDSARGFSDIEQLIRAGGLSEWVKGKAVSIFRRIGEAEAKVHGIPIDQVHFHEVGAIDSIVDIVGACVALEMLGKPEVRASEAVEGQGWVRCAHGRYPVPTAATLEILGARGIAITQCDEPGELITPTGAALLAEFSATFSPMRNLVAERIGYGAGSRENKTRPNVLRAILGKQMTERQPGDSGWDEDRVAVLESNLDDVSSEVLGHFMDEALRMGALDVFYVPITMKKSRPGVILSVLCAESEADRFSEMILYETSAFGLRRTVCERRKLKREVRHVKTPYGEADVKLGWLGDRLVHASPEFEVCKALANEAGVPVRVAMEAARLAAFSLFGPRFAEVGDSTSSHHL